FALALSLSKVVGYRHGRGEAATSPPWESERGRGAPAWPSPESRPPLSSPSLEIHPRGRDRRRRSAHDSRQIRSLTRLPDLLETTVPDAGSTVDHRRRRRRST
ncbi:Os11g0459400, partial [Oryza sativa Japonica Group]